MIHNQVRVNSTWININNGRQMNSTRKLWREKMKKKKPFLHIFIEPSKMQWDNK